MLSILLAGRLSFEPSKTPERRPREVFCSQKDSEVGSAVRERTRIEELPSDRIQRQEVLRERTEREE